MSKDLFQAASDNDIDALTTLLEMDPELVHARQPNTLWTPLHYAASQSLEAAERLLRGGAQPNAQGQCGESPLHLATAPEMARLLLAHGASPRLPDLGGTTPLDRAVQETMTNLFLALAEGAPELGSPNYQLLKVARQRKLLVEGTYHDHFRILKIITLGWTQREERCLAYQLTGTTDHSTPGWRCFKVAEFSCLYWGDPYGDEADVDLSKAPPPCVAVADETTYGELPNG